MSGDGLRPNLYDIAIFALIAGVFVLIAQSELTVPIVIIL